MEFSNLIERSVPMGLKLKMFEFLALSRKQNRDKTTILALTLKNNPIHHLYNIQ